MRSQLFVCVLMLGSLPMLLAQHKEGSTSSYIRVSSTEQQSEESDGVKEKESKHTREDNEDKQTGCFSVLKGL